MEQLEENFERVNYIDFINNINNHDQHKILMNIFTNESVCYLTKIVGVSKDSETVNDTVEIHMLGQQRGNKPRSSYKVTLQSKKFKCNCKDFIFRSETKKIVCKHISFIVFRCVKLYSNNYINTKVLKDNEIEKIISFLKNAKLYTLATFNNIDKLKDEEQECPICCEMLSCSIEEEKVVSCPTCKNVVHEECIRKWLKYNKSCVYCRSNSWKDF